MREKNLFQRNLIINIFKEAVESGLGYESIILLIFIYFSICNVYGSVINWPSHLRLFWLKVVKIHSDPERSEEKKKVRIYNQVKNKWFSLQGLNFPKKA